MAPLINPTNFLFFSLILIFIIYFKNKNKIVFKLFTLNIFLLFLISFLPLGNFGLKYLEKDFVNQDQYQNVENIIILSGSDYRLLASIKLANTYVNSKIYYIGGNAYLVENDIKDEIKRAIRIYEELNFDISRINFVGQSRNTIENFKEIKKLNLNNSNTILITSSYHMKRAMIIAEEFDIKVIPYVVNTKSKSQKSFLNNYQDFNISTNLANFNLFFREIIGIIVFKLTT